MTRAATPGQIVARLNGEIVRILHMPDVRKPIASQGNEVAAGTPGDFLASIREAMEKWGKVIRTAGTRDE